MSLCDFIIREVTKERTIAELLAKLEKLYMTKSLANRLYIKKRMFTLKMAEGSSLDGHIDEFNKIYDTLEGIDEGLDDEGKALLLVSLLPQSYSNFIDALMYGRHTLSLDEVNVALNAIGLQQKSGSMKSGEGLVAKGKGSKNDGKKKQKQEKNKAKSQNLWCFQCHKEGNFRKDFPEKKRIRKNIKMEMQQQLKKRNMSQQESVWPLRTCREVNGFLTLDVPLICALQELFF